MNNATEATIRRFLARETRSLKVCSGKASNIAVRDVARVVAFLSGMLLALAIDEAGARRSLDT
jgi:hypothetical protein